MRLSSPTVLYTSGIPLVRRPIRDQMFCILPVTFYPNHHLPAKRRYANNAGEINVRAMRWNLVYTTFVYICVWFGVWVDEMAERIPAVQLQRADRDMYNTRMYDILLYVTQRTIAEISYDRFRLSINSWWGIAGVAFSLWRLFWRYSRSID